MKKITQILFAVLASLIAFTSAAYAVSKKDGAPVFYVKNESSFDIRVSTELVKDKWLQGIRSVETKKVFHLFPKKNPNLTNQLVIPVVSTESSYLAGGENAKISFSMEQRYTMGEEGQPKPQLLPFGQFIVTAEWSKDGFESRGPGWIYFIEDDIPVSLETYGKMQPKYIDDILTAHPELRDKVDALIVEKRTQNTGSIDPNGLNAGLWDLGTFD